MIFKDVNKYRKLRAQLLRNQINKLVDKLKRDITILDLGGRVSYWNNLTLEGISKIEILNYDDSEITPDVIDSLFVQKVGDACDLTQYPDKSIDLVHSNSVIEHVGLWPDMEAMAKESRRVGLSGWIQTPAWEFPMEPHFRTPFLHWMGRPLHRKMLWFSKPYRDLGISDKRRHIERINLVSEAEMKELFPDCDIYCEKVFLFSKSYTARWMP